MTWTPAQIKILAKYRSLLEEWIEFQHALQALEAEGCALEDELSEYRQYKSAVAPDAQLAYEAALHTAKENLCKGLAAQSAKMEHISKKVRFLMAEVERNGKGTSLSIKRGVEGSFSNDSAFVPQYGVLSFRTLFMWIAELNAAATKSSEGFKMVHSLKAIEFDPNYGTLSIGFEGDTGDLKYCAVRVTGNDVQSLVFYLKKRLGCTHEICEEVDGYYLKLKYSKGVVHLKSDGRILWDNPSLQKAWKMISDRLQKQRSNKLKSSLEKYLPNVLKSLGTIMANLGYTDADVTSTVDKLLVTSGITPTRACDPGSDTLSDLFPKSDLAITTQSNAYIVPNQAASEEDLDGCFPPE